MPIHTRLWLELSPTRVVTEYSAVTRSCRYTRVREQIVYQIDTHKTDSLKSLQKE